MILANANDLAMIINYDCNHSFIALATGITIVNYDRKTFIVQATDFQPCPSSFRPHKHFYLSFSLLLFTFRFFNNLADKMNLKHLV